MKVTDKQQPHMMGYLINAQKNFQELIAPAVVWP